MQETTNELLIHEQSAEVSVDDVVLNETVIETPEENEQITSPEAATEPEEPVKPRRTRRTVKKEAEGYPVPDAGEVQAEPPADPPAEQQEQSDPQADGPPNRRRRQRSDGVISIDGGRSELTAEAKMHSDLIDLSESLRNRKILTGVIQGIESVGDSHVPAYAVTYHGAFKVVIPVEELVQLSGDTSADYMSAVMTRRLGAEIEYIIKGIDQASLVAAASRVDAMLIRRREFFQRRDEAGNTLLDVGSVAEARVVCVLQRGIFVELFGVESFIPRMELSNIRMSSAIDYFHVGERLLVKILEIDRTQSSGLRVELSVKAAHEDEVAKALERFVPGNLYSGIVSMISPAGIFVTMDNIVTCFCSFPPRTRPVVGTQVCVRVRGVNMERRQLWGIIIR